MRAGPTLDRHPCRRTHPLHDPTHADSQILIPDSFVLLYRPAGHSRPTLPRDELAARYELCEDLANHLVEQATTLHFQQGIAEDEVLTRCRRGLAQAASGFPADEAGWVVRRLAELLGWPDPGPDDPV